VSTFLELDRSNLTKFYFDVLTVYVILPFFCCTEVSTFSERDRINLMRDPAPARSEEPLPSFEFYFDVLMVYVILPFFLCTEVSTFLERDRSNLMRDPAPARSEEPLPDIHEETGK
jgi:multisubunit Na+/H+ antiporter MnhF subunit